MAKGSISILKTVSSSDAFVQNDAVEVTVKQPKKSFLKAAYIRVTSAPTVTASMDLGYKIGTATDGDQLALDADGIIDSAASTTPLALNAVAQVVLKNAGDIVASQTSIAGAFYTHDERTLYLNTTATNSAITDAGDVEWILEFALIED